MCGCAYLILLTAISRILLSMRIPSSRLVSVWFVILVHWIISVCCGGMIIVHMAIAVGAWGSVFCCAGFVRRVFQFWFIFIWFVAWLCSTSSVSARRVIICWILGCGMLSAVAISSVLCQTLSVRRLSSFSSLADMFGFSSSFFVSGFVLLLCCGVRAYMVDEPLG